MNHPVSVVCATHRPDPAFEWLADGLDAQLGPDDEIELILVDGLFSPERQERFRATVAGRFPFVHTPAKPTPFNGPWQRTSRPIFASASARNTGVVVASHPYLAFVDDCAALMPGWWDEVREAASHQYVVAGAYQKHLDVQVSDGVLRSSRVHPTGIDSRWELGDDRRVVPLAGGRLYGCSLGVPRRLMLEVNGFDELCDGIGGEDYNLGIRIELAGQRIFYDRRMLTIESQEHHMSQPVPARLDPVLDEPRYFQRLADFGVRARSTEGLCDASHMVLDLLYGLGQAASLGNPYQLSDLGPADLAATADRLPTVFWFDGRPLSEL